MATLWTIFLLYMIQSGTVFCTGLIAVILFIDNARVFQEVFWRGDCLWKQQSESVARPGNGTETVSL